MMKPVDIQMEIANDSEDKKITSIQPHGRKITLPDQCVICNQPSTSEVNLLLDVEGLRSAVEYQQRMPYCQKHQVQLSLIRLLNIIPAIITIGFAVYLFISFGGFGGNSTRHISSGIFLAFFLGAVLYFFIKPLIKSFRNGTSGSGVRLVHRNPSKEFSVEDNPTLLTFMFTNGEFAEAIVRKNREFLQFAEDEESVPTV